MTPTVLTGWKSQAAGPVGCAWKGAPGSWPGVFAAAGGKTGGATVSNHFALSPVGVGPAPPGESTRNVRFRGGGRTRRRGGDARRASWRTIMKLVDEHEKEVADMGGLDRTAWLRRVDRAAMAASGSQPMPLLRRTKRVFGRGLKSVRSRIPVRKTVRRKKSSSGRRRRRSIRARRSSRRGGGLTPLLPQPITNAFRQVGETMKGISAGWRGKPMLASSNPSPLSQPIDENAKYIGGAHTIDLASIHKSAGDSASLL